MDLRNIIRPESLRPFRKPGAWPGKTTKSRSNSRSKAHEAQPVIHGRMTILTFDVNTRTHSLNFVTYFLDFCNEEGLVIHNLKR